MKKKLCSLSLVLVLALGCMSSASAAFIPDDVDYRELNGQQQAIKVYTLLPGDDPNELREEDFEHDGFLYAFSDMTKLEQVYSEDQPHTETVTVNTSSKDLAKAVSYTHLGYQFMYLKRGEISRGILGLGEKQSGQSDNWKGADDS